jgi:hypothetical protein
VREKKAKKKARTKTRKQTNRLTIMTMKPRRKADKKNEGKIVYTDVLN